MMGSCSNFFRRMTAGPAAIVVLGLVACNGTAVVTLTATPSTDNFLAYRVGLVSVELTTSDGKTSSKALPASTTVDLAHLVDVSEVLGAGGVAKANYQALVVTVDYGSAQIVYDDGSVNGMALTPVNASGAAAGQVKLSLTLDPADSYSISSSKVARLSLNFDLAASNIVNTTNKTVTVKPLITGSANSIDAKLVRLRGPLTSVDTANTRYTTGVEPFDFPVLGSGSLVISPSDVTTYEINGAAYTGALGLTTLGSLSPNAMTVTLGTLTSATTTTTTTSSGTTTTNSSTDLTFSPTQVYAGTSVQSTSFDRVSGTVSARSGNTLTIEDATLLGVDGSNTFLPGTATVNVGANTVVTLSGQGTAELNTAAQVSVGSVIHAFGAASTPTSGNVTLDASAGLVQIGLTTASGLVTSVGSGTLDLNLTSLGGRSLKAFDFAGTGANAASYVVNTGALALTNSTAGVPVAVTGLVASFGAASPNLTASTLLDPTTIAAQLVIDYGTGTVAPFTTYDSSAMDIDVRNASIGTRHLILVGSQSINVVGLSSDPLITSTTSSTMLFSIGHTASGSVENFDTYAAFITALQSELNGSTLATGITAVGVYTASTYSFSATSISLVLNN
jgi:hypothetical protein